MNKLGVKTGKFEWKMEDYFISIDKLYWSCVWHDLNCNAICVLFSVLISYTLSMIQDKVWYIEKMNYYLVLQ